ncbi:MAG: response regulator [Bdellovibrionota bacterium]
MGRKLLVADDSVTIQKVIKLALSSEGYDILAVSDGKEAIRAIQEEKPDVVLIDLALPIADAYSVKRAINENPGLASIGFILLVSAFEKVDERIVDELQFHGRLIRPFDPSQLRKAVADLMSKLGSPGSPRKKATTPNADVPPPPPPEVTGPGLVMPPIPPRPQSLSIELTEPVQIPGLPATPDLTPVTDMHPVVPDEPLVTSEPVSIELASPMPPPLPVYTSPEKTDPDLGVLPPEVPDDHDDSDENVEAQEAQAHRALENDIKDLTESTIKMSGLDEFEWNLDDSKKMKAPSEIRPRQTPERLENTIEIKKPLHTERAEAPLKTLMSPPSKPIDDGGTNFPLRTPPSGSDLISGKDFAPKKKPPEPKQPAQEPRLVSGQNEPAFERPSSAQQQPGSAAVSPPITRAEIEQMIRKDVAAAIEKLAKEAVPQIAENVIRKEIEKILSET